MYRARRGTQKINIFSFSVTFISWINRQEEHRLSSAQNLTSRYQSIVDNRMKIECASDVVNVREYSSSNHHIVLLHRINKIVSRMSLKSTEVENCSRLIRAILISSFGSSSCSQTSFPSIIRPIMYLWMMISKMKFYLVKFNWSIFFSL